MLTTEPDKQFDHDMFVRGVWATLGAIATVFALSAFLLWLTGCQASGEAKGGASVAGREIVRPDTEDIIINAPAGTPVDQLIPLLGLNDGHTKVKVNK